MLGVQHLHVGLPQAADGADILPVAAEVVGVHTAAVLQQVGNDILAEIVLGVGVSLILGQVLLQDIPVEDVDTHGSQIGLRVLRLLLEFVDAVVLIGDHQAEAGSLAPWHLHDGNGEFCVLFLVEAQEVRVILLADLIAGQDDDILGIIAVDEGQVLINGVGGALVPVRAAGLLVGRQDMYAAVQTVQVPRLAVADILIQDKRLILGQNTNGINVGVDTVGEREIDDTIFSAKRNGRLGELLGQRIEA